MNKEIKFKSEFPIIQCMEAISAITPIVDELNKIADALDYTGNTKLGDKIGVLADSIQIFVDTAHSKAGESVNETTKASEQATKNMMELAVSVLTTPKAV